MNTVSHILRRAKRTALAEALADARIDAATRALRSLAAGNATPTEARAIVDQYCKVMHFEPASSAALDYLCSAEAAMARTEEIDEMLMYGDDGFAAAHDAINRARRGR